MKVLVTGATGFLGSHLVQALIREGYKVAILKRSFSNTDRIAMFPQLDSYNIDHCRLEQPFIDNGKIDAIIHAATCYGRQGESISNVFEANVVFPLKLLEVATYYKTDTFINADTVLSSHLNSYTLSKSQFTEWGKQLSSMRKIRFINVRLEHMYGAGDDESKFATYVINSCLANAFELKLTAGEQKRDFIYIDDVVSAYFLLLEKAHRNPELYQEYGLGSGKAISIREFVQTVHHITNSKIKLSFGALPYRDNEIMESLANIEPLLALGWTNKTSLIEGIEAVVREELRNETFNYRRMRLLGE